jgi:hypothetical protein
MRKLIKINTNKFRIGETYPQPVEQPVYQQEVKTPVDIQSILDKYNTKGQFTETSPEDHEILLNYILGEREREEIENGIKQQGGKILDQNGYLLSNFLNFTPKKVIQGDANGTTITTNGMAFPVLANGKKLFPNTGEYRFKESFVEEVPMYQKGGGVQPIIVNSKNDPRYRSYQDSLNLYNQGEKFKNLFIKSNLYHPNPEIEKLKITSSDKEKIHPFGSIVGSGISKYIKDNGPSYIAISNKKIQPVKNLVFTRKESDTKTRKEARDIINRTGTLGDLSWIGHGVQQYKKPVQPVIYEPNNTFEDNEGNIVSSGINKPTGKPQLVQMIKRNENVPQQLNPLSIINTREIPEQDSLKVTEPIDYNQNKLNLTKSLPLEEGTYFTRENQLQEIGGKRYVDKKTGKLIGEMKNGNFEYNPLWLEMNPDLKNEVAEFKKGGKTTQEPNQFIPIMEQKEQQYGLPKGLLKGVAQTESNFNPNAVSEKSGATGLMQFMPQTAKQYGIDPTDPIQSIDASARMLKDLHKQFGNWDDALRAYNFGSGNVMKWKQGKKDLPKETREYVGKVYNNANLTSEVNSNYIGLANQKGVSKDGYEEYEDTYLEDDEFVDIEEEMEFENKLDEAIEEEEQQIAEMEDQEDEMMQQQEIEEEQFVSGQEIQNQMLELEQAERRDRVMSILNMFNS